MQYLQIINTNTVLFKNEYLIKYVIRKYIHILKELYTSYIILYLFNFYNVFIYYISY